MTTPIAKLEALLRLYEARAEANDPFPPETVAALIKTIAERKTFIANAVRKAPHRRTAEETLAIREEMNR